MLAIFIWVYAAFQEGCMLSKHLDHAYNTQVPGQHQMWPVISTLVLHKMAAICIMQHASSTSTLASLENIQSI